MRRHVPMQDQSVDKKTVFTSLYRVGLFYFAGLSIFFIVAFVIISLRISVKEKVETPLLQGNLYIDEHNRLNDLGFRVSIEKMATNEYLPGTIVAQNIAPGKIVKQGASLTLLVSQGDPVIEVPRLTGLAIELAKQQLQSIPRGSRIYTLKEGTISIIPSDKPAGEVLAQDPPAGARIAPGSPVSLLVSGGPKNLQTLIQLDMLKGAPAGLASKFAFETKIIVEYVVQTTDDYASHGIIQQIEMADKNKKWSEAQGATAQVTVARYNPREPLFHQKKRALSSDLFPNRTVFQDARKAGLPKGKVVTMARRHITKNGSVEYSDFAYFRPDVFPVFLLSNDSFSVWEGYHNPMEVKQEETTAPEGATAVFASSSSSSSEASVLPEKIIRFKTISL